MAVTWTIAQLERNTDNDFCSDMTDAEVKERVMRSSGYLSAGVAMDDWGSEDMSTINAAITAAEAA